MSITILSSPNSERALLLVKTLTDLGFSPLQNSFSKEALDLALNENSLVLYSTECLENTHQNLIQIPSKIEEIPHFVKTCILPKLQDPFFNFSIEKALLSQMIKKQLTLSTAESCTGGYIASRLTQIPSASSYYLGSVIAYSNFLKVHLLGVDPQLIDEKGAVSEEVVKMMATGIQSLTKSDYSIAVSGIAGPDGGTKEKPVGTVWCAIYKKNEDPKTILLKLQGNRKSVIYKTANELLAELYREVVLS